MVYFRTASVAASFFCFAVQTLASDSNKRVHLVRRTSFLSSAGNDEAAELTRMRYYAPADRALETSDRYVLFTQDAGGLNNIRLGWEMSGLVAQYTGRTLVLPPPQNMYLLDWGPRSPRYLGNYTVGSNEWQHMGKTETRTMVEDLINLKQLKGTLPTMTWDEFHAKTGMSMEQVEGKSTELPTLKVSTDHGTCDLREYARVDVPILFMNGAHPYREGFKCSDWSGRGAPNAIMKKHMGPDGWALLQHGFVWHEDAFKIASTVVSYLGLFKYNAMHARLNDFQWKMPQTMLHRWENALSSSETLYVATDDPEKVRKVFKPQGVRMVSWDDFFEDSTGKLLEPLRRQYSEERWFKLTGLVEELICTYSRLFVGTSGSTFSGHIERMRVEAGAPKHQVLSLKSRMTDTLKRQIDQVLLGFDKDERAHGFHVDPEKGNVFLQMSG